MDSITFAGLAEALARQLGELRGEEWTAELDPQGGTYGVLLVGIARLAIHWDSRQGKLAVSGQGPDPARGRAWLSGTWDIRTDPARGLLTTAKDINRRILGAGYADDMLVARAKKTARDVADGERASWLDAAAELFGITRPATHERGADPTKVYLQQFVKGSGYVQTYGHGDTDTGYLDINLSGIPGPVALDMLKVLADSQPGAQCCFTYGPGHPPQFRVAGCLGHTRLGDGETPSRVRVYEFLTASRGLDKAAVVMAMDEARELGASVIEPDGQVLAVITWDHEGCGEYTAEVPRGQS